CAITDQSDTSKAAVVVSNPVTIICEGVSSFKAVEGASPAVDNYLFSTASEGVVFKDIAHDGNRDIVTGSYGIQINNSKCKVIRGSLKNMDGASVLVQGLDELSPIERVRIVGLDIENSG